MDELIKNFHINWQLLAAQIVNFAIVVGVLWFFALKPLIKKMNERTSYIEKSLEDAKQVEANLAKAEELKKERLADATREAERIIKEAKKVIEREKQEALGKTKNEAEKVVAEAKEQIVVEKEKAEKEIRGKVSELVILAVEKILKENVSKSMDEKKIAETIESLEK
ncbi:MAG: F0F1 ATP synthase subunit B [Patescibacteria group bacterium]|nr:F0F1 ATP synthase subunit B [Patescibacteria group bacterium]MDD5490437.1 F0F1 ATP synthase subunit B [Patescibacteria group bacterium]